MKMPIMSTELEVEEEVHGDWLLIKKQLGDVLILAAKPINDLVEHTDGICLCGPNKEKSEINLEVNGHVMKTMTLLKIEHQAMDGRT